MKILIKFSRTAPGGRQPCIRGRSSVYIYYLSKLTMNLLDTVIKIRTLQKKSKVAFISQANVGN